MPSSNSDRNLLFGILALQMDFINRECLIKAMNDWVLDKDKPLGELLVANHALSLQNRELLEQMVDAHVKAHDDDPEKSLASLSSVGPVQSDLAKLEDSDVQEAMTYVSMATPAANEDVTITQAGPSSSSSVGEQSSLDARFRIVRPHAEGGLGKVSVAVDQELNREVALKEIKESYSYDESARTRFTLEAEITGGLEHPGIVPVYGLGHRDDGQPFYAMRFIKGDSLKDACSKFHAGKDSRSETENTLEFRKLLGRFIDVCNAIEYAHSRGVLHRDLKPGNIMLGKYGETLVVDWGLAKAIGRDEVFKDLDEQTLQPSSADSTPATQMGSALGTPHFMSPEQAAGKLDELGPASDVYSLGATLYYLLANRAPFTDRNVDLVLAKVQMGEFEKPREVDASVPKPLEAICLKAMSRESTDRYELPNDMANDVSRWLADEPVEACAEPVSVRINRWLRNHPRTVSSIAATFVIGLVASVLISLVIESNNRELNTAYEAERTAKDELSSTNLQLEMANENLVSANELVQTQKQELADQNQELTNVNAQLETTNASLSESNERLDYGLYVSKTQAAYRELELKNHLEASRILSELSRSGFESSLVGGMLDNSKVVLSLDLESDDALAYDTQADMVAISGSENGFDANGVYDRGFIHLYGMESRERLGTIPLGDLHAIDLRFSRDGGRLFALTKRPFDIRTAEGFRSTSASSGILVFDLSTNELTEVISSIDTRIVSNWQVSADGRYVSAVIKDWGKQASNPSRSVVIQVDDGRVVFDSSGGCEASAALSSHRDEFVVAVQSESQVMVQVCDAKSGDVKHELLGLPTIPSAIAISADSDHVFAAASGSLYEWTLQDEGVIGPSRFELGFDDCRMLTPSPDGKMLIAMRSDRNSLFALGAHNAWEKRFDGFGHDGAVVFAEFTRDMTSIVSIAEGFEVRISPIARSPKLFRTGSYAVDFFGDDSISFVEHEGNTTRLRTQSLGVEDEGEGPSNSLIVNRLDYEQSGSPRFAASMRSADREEFVVLGWGKSGGWFNSETGKNSRAFHSKMSIIDSALNIKTQLELDYELLEAWAISCDHRYVGFVADNRLHVWDVIAGKFKLQKPLESSHSKTAITFTSNPDRILYDGSGVSVVFAVDLETGEEREVRLPDQGGITHMATSPRTGFVAMNHLDLTRNRWAVSVMDPSSFEIKLRLEFARYPTSLAFHPDPDAALLAIGCQDGVVILWNLKTNQEALTLRELTTPIVEINFSADGSKLMAVTTDGCVIWRPAQ